MQAESVSVADHKMLAVYRRRRLLLPRVAIPMAFVRILFVAAVWGFLAAASALAQSVVSIKTADTSLLFDDSTHSVLALQTADGTTWKNRAPDTLPPSVEIDGKTLALRWSYNPAASHADKHTAQLVFESSNPHLRLTWEWQARADFGPIEHQIRIENLDSRELWIPLFDSFQFDWQIELRQPLEHLFVEKGADTPSPVGTHLLPITNGYDWQGTSSTYANPRPDESREIIPWMLVERPSGSQSGWYVGIEFSGRTRLSLSRSSDSLRGALGWNPNPGPARTRLRPGDTFESPTIFLGGATGGPDAAGNILRHWVREVLVNPADRSNPHYPTLTNNSWGSGMQIDESLALRMLNDSADLGFEMFHIDAGWFRSVGDWVPNPAKFPHGLATIADQAHRLGLKFGLWVDWTQAGLSTNPGALNVNDPKVQDWLVAGTPPGWKPEEFKGQTIDIGAPAAMTWASAELEHLVSDYHLDMLEHDGYLVAQGCVRTDHPHAPPDLANLRVLPLASSFLVESSNSTDVSYHAVRNYYSLYSELRKNHPALLFEVCNDGGRMVDFGSAAHADYFSITDTYDPLSNRRAFYDASHVLPSAMLETYVEKWSTPTVDNFRYMLRSGMMGWLTLMLDTTSWTPEQHRAAQTEFDLYKSTLRGFIRDADLYHVSSRPDGIHWDAIEYFDSARRAGVIYAFRGSVADEPIHIFLLKGLQADRNYRIHFQDGTSPDQLAAGAELLRSGLRLSLPSPYSSELVFFTETQ